MGVPCSSSDSALQMVQSFTSPVFGDLFSQSFCCSLHLLGIDRHAGQFGQEFATFLEADHRTDGAYHAREGWRERGVFYAQLLIARTEAVSATGAVIVGALKM